MAYDLTRADPMVPADHRRWLAEHGAPPPGTVVLLARCAGQRFPLFSAHGGHTFDIRVGSQPRQKWAAYMTSASIGPVVLLFGHGMRNVGGLRPRTWKADFAEVIWPEPHLLPWPLPRLGGRGASAVHA